MGFLFTKSKASRSGARSLARSAFAEDVGHMAEVKLAFPPTSPPSTKPLPRAREVPQTLVPSSAFGDFRPLLRHSMIFWHL